VESGFLASDIFAWSAVLRKILTMDNLKKRHIIMVDWCCMFKKSGESKDHLLLQCEIVNALWNTILSSVRLAWVMPSQVVTILRLLESTRC
jgi:hypothetical protein